jgi:hypothetical protein
MRLLLLLVSAGCTPREDTASNDPPGETGETGQPRDCAPADEEPGLDSEGHPSDGWRWTKHGALFDDGESLGYGDGDLAPALVDTGEGLHLVFTRQRGLDQDLWVSTSADGVTWSEPVAATGLPAGSGGYPGLLADGGGFRLWYGSGELRQARSADGVAWTPEGATLAPEEGYYSLLYPSPLRYGSATWLYHTAFDGQRYTIRMASTVDDGASWGVAVDVWGTDPDGFDNAAVAQPAAVQGSTGWHLWYGGYDTSQTNPGPWRIGLASGPSADHRLRQGVSLPLSETGPDAWSTRDPAVIPWGEGWLMIYTGMGDDGVYRLMRATSDVCN